MMPRRCIEAKGGRVHGAIIYPKHAFQGEAFCGTRVQFMLVAPENRRPVTCKQCLAALSLLQHTIDACIEGRSG